jgi:hypothetical protein
LVKLLPATGLSNQAWIQAAAAAGIKRTAYYELRAELDDKGMVEERIDKETGKKAKHVWVPVK